MRPITSLILLFVLAQFMGLVFGFRIFSVYQNVPVTGIFATSNSLIKSVYLFSILIISTTLIILILKIKKNFIIYFEDIALFVLIFYALDLYLPDLLSIVLSFLIVYYTRKKPNWYNKTFCTLVSVSSAGAFLGYFLDLKSSIIFGLILSIYDFVSVFITKHMVFMAKEMSSRETVFMLKVPTKESRRVKLGKIKKITFVALGSGDMLIPITFSVSVLKTYGLFNSICTIIFSSIFLLILFYYQSRKKEKSVLPALPFVFSGSLTGFLLSIMI